MGDAQTKCPCWSGNDHICTEHGPLATIRSKWAILYHVPRSQVWPGSRGGQPGAIHLHATEDVTVGRIHRWEGGAALCGRRGWYERPVEHESDLRVRCAECKRRATRYEIAWPA